jgi:hypothetical protein
MRPALVLIAAALAASAPLTLAQTTAPQDGPYKVLKTARVGGEGGWDYIYANADGRRLYIPRGATRAVPATDTTREVAAVPERLTIFDLDTLKPLGEISGIGGNGTAVDAKTNHGFTSDHPKVSMFDTTTMTLIKSIDVGTAARPDGIYFDPFNEHVYVFSHPTKDATVIDAKDGTMLGAIDLGGTPEQGVGDGKGMLYVVMQDAVGSVTAVDVKTMKAVAHYTFVDKGGCNGLAIDAKNEILFAACSRPQPTMVIMSAKDGNIRRSHIQPRNDGGIQHGRQRHHDHREREQSHQLRGRAEPADDEWCTHRHIRQQDRTPVHDVPGTWPCTSPCACGNWRTVPRRTRPAGYHRTGLVHHPDGRQAVSTAAPESVCPARAHSRQRT